MTRRGEVLSIRADLSDDHLGCLASDARVRSSLFPDSSACGPQTDRSSKWWTRNAIAVVGLASLLTAAFVHAGAGDGLEGGSVAALAIDPKTPTTVYAGTGGVLKSSDGGAHWAAVNSGLADLNVETVALDPRNPAILYAATYGGIFKSTNGGESWTGLH